VDLADADGLVSVLLSWTADQTLVSRSDIDQNGVVDGRDISAFLTVLLQPH